jgi:ribonuclease HI
VEEEKKINRITIQFDGGCRPTNPGNKYGSYVVLFNGRQVAFVSRLELGLGTSNEAEFQILERALAWTVDAIKDSGNSPSVFSVELFSDSRIVINRLLGNKKGKDKKEAQIRMKQCAAKCLEYLIRFKSFDATWESRWSNVARFGH